MQGIHHFPLGWATTLCATPTVNATTTHHTTSQAHQKTFRLWSLPLLISPSLRFPSSFYSTRAVSNIQPYRPPHACSAVQHQARGERMRHVNHRIVRHPIRSL